MFKACAEAAVSTVTALVRHRAAAVLHVPYSAASWGVLRFWDIDAIKFGACSLLSRAAPARCRLLA
jgi:hypothetical protein